MSRGADDPSGSLFPTATRPSVLGDRLIDRVGLVGMLLGSIGLAVADFVTALTHAPLSLAFTIAETALVLPWAMIVFRLDRRDPSYRKQRGLSRLRPVAVHIVNVALVALVLSEKWVVLMRAHRYGVHLYIAQYRIFTLAAYLLVNVGLLGRGSRVGRLLVTLSEHPARLTTLSFGLTSLFGGLLLNLPQALRHVRDASFVDGLFTSMSAVCVTGLVVHGTAETYTPFGQAVIFCLFQAGGLGIMVLSSAFAILAGRRLRMRSSAVLAEMVDAESMDVLRRTVVSIVTYTFVIELVGALILFLAFQAYPATALGPASPNPAAGAGDRLWAAVFHSVSAFCNAGFSIFHANAEAFSGNWVVSLTISGLIVLGGIGFPVLREVVDHVRARVRHRRPKRVTLHTRVAVITTCLLIGVGTIGILALEWNGTMAGRPWDERLLTAIFQSVTTRTAGFNTLPIGALSAPTLMLMCLLMFIGASPGSTGGGVKTTTVAVLFSMFRAELSGNRSPRLLDRAISPAVQQRAVGVFFLSVAIVATMLFALMITEHQAPLRLAFETFSAFGTVGLSTGITPDLSVAGKLIVTLTMFVGRIGPLTLALALAVRQPPRTFHPPEERVGIG